MSDPAQMAAALLYRQGMTSLEAQPACHRFGIIHAIVHTGLAELAAAVECRIQQTDRVQYLALAAQNLEAEKSLQGVFDCILLLASRHRLQTLGWMASAMRHLEPGGTLICCVPNTMGARSYEKRLHELGGNIRSASKSRCRIFSCRRTRNWNTALADAWEAEAGPRRITGSGLYARPGLFSWRQPDPGSRLLLEYLPSDLSGTGMDLCCGYGFLAAGLLAHNAGIEALHLVDTEQLALECARLNLAQYGRTRLMYHWLDAASEPLPGEPDWIVLNPPFHSGSSQDIALGRRMILVACDTLKPGGRLFMVANRRLPYEAVLRTGLKRYRPLYEGMGYKVICGEK